MTNQRPPVTIELPASTIWPLVLGLGVTLAFAGIVTHWLVSAAGLLLALAGAAGWWREVLPRQNVETFVVEEGRRAAAAGAPAPRVGERRHRMRLPVEIHPYSAGIRGGLAGAVSMAVVALGWGAVHGSIWYPINLLAAIAMTSLTEGGVETLRSFSLAALVVAIVIHVVVSMLVGLIFAIILPMLPRRPLLMGGLISPALWSALLLATMWVLNPALNKAVSWPWFIASQFAFGVTAGWVVSRTERVRTLQAVPLAERLGVKTGGRS
jgi:hypothetical protein